MANALATQVGGNHYKEFKIQPAEFIEKNNLGFLEGCIIKRVCRLGRKGGKEQGIEDLNKIIHEAKLILEMRYGIKE